MQEEIDFWMNCFITFYYFNELFQTGDVRIFFYWIILHPTPVMQRNKIMRVSIQRRSIWNLYGAILAHRIMGKLCSYYSMEIIGYYCKQYKVRYQPKTHFSVTLQNNELPKYYRLFFESEIVSRNLLQWSLKIPCAVLPTQYSANTVLTLHWYFMLDSF